jgi:hypothetical protein
MSAVLSQSSVPAGKNSAAPQSVPFSSPAENAGRILHLTFEEGCPVFFSCLDVRMTLKAADKGGFDEEFFDRLPHLLARQYAKEHDIKTNKCHSIALQTVTEDTYEAQTPGVQLSYLLTTFNMSICKNTKPSIADYFNNKNDLQNVREKYLSQIGNMCLGGKYDLTRPPKRILVDEPLPEKKSYWSLKKKSADQKAADITLDFLKTNIVASAMNKLKWPEDDIGIYLTHMKPLADEIRERQALSYKNTG